MEGGQKGKIQRDTMFDHSEYTPRYKKHIERFQIIMHIQK